MGTTAELVERLKKTSNGMFEVEGARSVARDALSQIRSGELLSLADFALCDASRSAKIAFFDEIERHLGPQNLPEPALCVDNTRITGF